MIYCSENLDRFIVRPFKRSNSNFTWRKSKGHSSPGETLAEQQTETKLMAQMRKLSSVA